MDIGTLLGILCVGAFGLVLLGLFALVVVGTILRKTPFGINFKPVTCPKCGEPAPKVRAPANMRQTLWGGGTCAKCDCEYDKWGTAIGA